MNQSHNSQTPKVVGVIVMSAVLIIGVYTLIIKKSDTSLATANTSNTNTVVTPANTTTSTDQTRPTTASSTPVSPTSSSSTPTYKDGTYTKTSSYRVPGGGVNKLSATIALKDGSITSVTTTNQYDERESRMYVTSFSSSIKNVVSGHKLSNSYVGRVGGASLTSSAFNDILDAIISDAKA